MKRGQSKLLSTLRHKKFWPPFPGPLKDEWSWGKSFADFCSYTTQKRPNEILTSSAQKHGTIFIHNDPCRYFYKGLHFTLVKFIFFTQNLVPRNLSKKKYRGNFSVFMISTWPQKSSIVKVFTPCFKVHPEFLKHFYSTTENYKKFTLWFKAF